MEKKFNIIILIAFIILTGIFTYPLAFHITSHIPGFSETTESLSVLNDMWWSKYASLHDLNFAARNYIAYPFGVPITKWISDYPIWTFINKMLSISFGEILTFNVNILFSFITSCFFMYLLVSYLTKSKLSGFLAGIIYSFSPYHFVRAWQHLGLAHIEWLPLFLLFILKLKEEPKLKNVLLLAVGYLLIFSFDFYYAYFAVIVSAIFCVFLIFYQFRDKVKKGVFVLQDVKLIFQIIAAFLFSIIILSPVIIAILKDIFNAPKPDMLSAYTTYHRPLGDLFSQSAKFLSYLLPASTHPILGKFTEMFVGTKLYGESFTEHTLYLGWVPLVLAFIAFRGWRRNRKSLVNQDFYIGFFIFLAISVWLFSQPPLWEIGPLKIFMPSWFMYKILPMFRAYCRFGIVVMLAVAVLAGFGLKFMLAGFKTANSKIAVAILFCVLVLFEFWNYPPLRVIDLSQVPAVYGWLKKQSGDFAIAEYPLDLNSPSEAYRFFQTVHEKRIINCSTPGTEVNKIVNLTKELSVPMSASILKWMGAKYVLVHADGYLETELVSDKEELSKIPKNPGLKLIANFPAQDCPTDGIMCSRKTGPIDVYEIIASAIKPELKSEELR